MLLKKLLTVIRKILEHKSFPLVIAIIAFLVSLPTVNCGLFADDLIHRSMLVNPDRLPEGIYKVGLKPESPGKLSTALFDLFAFFGDEQLLTEGRNYGVIPWWCPKGMKGALWRPLSSFTHWLDYRLFPDSAALMHVHHLLWFSAVIFLIAVFYRRLIGPIWVAALAVILFLIDENNVFPLMLNAHRNSFLAMFFGLLCALSHHNWRKSNSRSSAIAAPIFLLLSLLSAEAGIATFAFILAYALVLEETNFTKRIATLIPSVCTIIIWRLVYNSLGYGAAGVGLYIDPVSEPVRFTFTLLERLPLMLFGIFSPVSVDFALSMSPSAKTWFLIIAVACLLLLFVIILPLLRKNRLALFFALATVFAVIPFCAAFVSSRNLLFASVPAFALIAIFITDVFKKASYLPKALSCRIVIWLICISLLLIHLPAALLGRVIGQKMTYSILFSSIGAPKEFIEDARLDRHIVVINAPVSLSNAFLPFELAYRGLEPPRSFRTLVPAMRKLEIQRADERTLIIKSVGGDFFSCDELGPMHLAYLFKNFNDLFPMDKYEFKPGHTAALPDMTAKVIKVARNAMPVEISFTFAVPLEDKSLCFYWYSWNWIRYERFEIPAVGQKVDLPGPSYVSLSGALKFIKSTVVK